MTRSRVVLAASAIAAVVLAAAARADEPKWKQHTINGQSEFEAAGVFDVDNDGKLDIVSGDTWYQAPDWKPYHVRDVEAAGHLLQRFRDPAARRQRRRPHRFRHVLLLRQERRLGREPGKAGAAWTYHEVDVPGNIEAAWMVDLSGDGVPDILPNTVNVVVWYEVVKKGDGKGFELKKHDFGTHGGRARRRLGRRQRRRPRRPAHAQGLVRGPGRSRARHLGLASRLAARRDRHPDPGARRRRRWTLRHRLRHGPRLRAVLAPSGQGLRRRADLDQAGDRQDDRVGPCAACGPTSTATARPTSW